MSVTDTMTKETKTFGENRYAQNGFSPNRYCFSWRLFDRLKTGQDLFGQGRELSDAHAGGIADGVGYSGMR
jgi:hypothetical protein